MENIENNTKNAKEEGGDFKTKIAANAVRYEKTEEKAEENGTKRADLVSQKLLADSLDLEIRLDKLPL